MKEYLGITVAAGVGFLFAGLGMAAAQDQAGGTTPPPKVMVIQNEHLKPGKDGGPHVKTESAFVQAFKDAKWPEGYVGADSLSGPVRSLFFIGYDSFAAWEKDVQAAEQNATLSAALDQAKIADGELLESYASSTFRYRDDLSLRAPVDIAHMRYMDITVVRVRPGHGHDFEDYAKLYTSAYEKIPGAHWAAYEDMYGSESGDRFIFISPMKSLAEVDQEMADEKQVHSGMSADQMKKMADLAASTVQSSEANLFKLNPKISYPPESWVKADPSFWGAK
jgi:hypothetical protein